MSHILSYNQFYLLHTARHMLQYIKIMTYILTY